MLICGFYELFVQRSSFNSVKGERFIRITNDYYDDIPPYQDWLQTLRRFRGQCLDKATL